MENQRKLGLIGKVLAGGALAGGVLFNSGCGIYYCLFKGDEIRGGIDAQAEALRQGVKACGIGSFGCDGLVDSVGSDVRNSCGFKSDGTNSQDYNAKNMGENMGGNGAVGYTP